jgi:hypothetical protein
MDGKGSKRWTLHPASYAVGFLTASLAGLGGLALLYACGMSPFATFRTSCSVLGMQLYALGGATADSAEASGELPPSLETLAAPDGAGRSYLKAVPDDPWGRAYLYELQPDGGARIASRGEDGLAHTGDDIAFVIERGPTWVVREATSAEVEAAGR